MNKIKKLKALRRAIKNIPKENINYDSHVSQWSDITWRKCVMCPASWAATDPFIAGPLIDVCAGDIRVSNKAKKLGISQPTQALMRVFNLSLGEVNHLFYDVSHAPIFHLNHKKWFLRKLTNFINQLEG